MASIEQKAVAQGLSGKARPRLSWTPRNEVAPKSKELRDLVPVLRKKYGHLVDKYASKYNVDPALFYVMMAKESGGDERAVSPAGARGLMQLMKPTWEEWKVSDPFDPEQNIAAGAQELSRLDRVFKGDRELMLAGYNLGMGNVRKAQAGKREIPKETRDYVASIMGALDVEKPPEAEGGPVPPPDFIGAGARPKPVKPPSTYKQKSMHGGASARKEPGDG